MGSVKMRPGVLAAFMTKRLEIALKAASDAGRDAVRENIKRGSRSGVQYPGQPARASAPGEFPQRQTGQTREKIKSVRRAPLSYGFGVIDATKKEFNLELGAPGTDKGQRRFLSRTALDPAVQARMRDAMRQKAGIR